MADASLDGRTLCPIGVVEGLQEGLGQLVSIQMKIFPSRLV